MTTTYTTTCTRYPHPDDDRNNIFDRIERKVSDIKRRYPEAVDTAKSAALDAAPDLGAIEDALDNLIAAMDYVDRLADDRSPATAAALEIEARAFQSFYATVED